VLFIGEGEQTSKVVTPSSPEKADQSRKVQEAKA
jgi:hypothetical protein